jgi:hypothetical protein
MIIAFPSISSLDTIRENTMSLIQLDIPEEVLISLKERSSTVPQQILTLAAIKLFELGKPSL